MGAATIASAMPGNRAIAPHEQTVRPADAADRLRMSKSRVQHLCLAYRVRVTADQERYAAEVSRRVSTPRPVDYTQHMGELACWWDELKGKKTTIVLYHLYEWGLEQFKPNPTRVGKPAGITGTRSGSSSRPLAAVKQGPKTGTRRRRTRVASAS